MDPTNNFEAYRNRLRVLRDKCCIPCLAIHLHDLQGLNWSTEMQGERAVRFGWCVGQLLVFQRWLGIYQRELGPPWRGARQMLLALPRHSEEDLRDISFDRYKGKLVVEEEDLDDDLDEVSSASCRVCCWVANDDDVFCFIACVCVSVGV